MAIKKLPVFEDSDARPRGYEAGAGRAWHNPQTFWAEGDHETVISALQMMIQIEVVYQKYLVNGSDAVAEKITEILGSVDDYGALRFSPMMEGGVAKHVELLATRRWGKSQGGRGGMSMDADGVQRFEFKTSGKSTMTEFPADVKLKEDGSNSDDYFKYQFRLYKALRANASRTKCAGSLNESTLQAAAKSSQHIRDSWVNFGLAKGDDASWTAKNDHEKITEFLMFQLDAVEKLGPIIVKMARQEFRKVKQSSGGMESVSFFKEFKEGADNLYVLSSKQGRVDPTVSNEDAKVAECMERLSVEVKTYVEHICQQKCVVHKDAAYAGHIPPDLATLEQIVTGFTNTRAINAQAMAGLNKAVDQKKTKEFKALEAKFKDLEIKFVGSQGSGNGSNGGRGGRGRGGGAGGRGGDGGRGGGAANRTLVPHDIMPDVFAKGEGEFPPLLMEHLHSKAVPKQEGKGLAPRSTSSSAEKKYVAALRCVQATGPSKGHIRAVVRDERRLRPTRFRNDLPTFGIYPGPVDAARRRRNPTRQPPNRTEPSPD